MYNVLPEELRSLPQWVCWRYELEPGCEKPTKVPVNPHNGYNASPTNPKHWGTFEQAVSVMHNCNGIGFVITSNDPYVCLDFDSTNDKEILELQNKIYNSFESYSEISPSGKGCHIWIKGKVPHNRNRALVEIYTAGHYMTITANCCRNLPIKDYHELVNQLWEQMEVKPKQEGVYLNKPEVHTDYEILTMASTAANGQKFINLYENRWSEYYPEEAAKGKQFCNEADQSLCNILAFYTQNREQIKRIFRASPLGQRSKSKREDYFENPKFGMLNKAFDLTVDCDLSDLRNNLEQQLSAKQAATVKPEPAQQEVAGSGNEPQLREEQAVNVDPTQIEDSQNQNIHISADTNIDISKYSKSCIFEFTPPPGLIGDIAKFIYDAAPRPVPEIAIAGAIGLMAGVCGRSYNISGTGLNQYILLLGFTGSGKEGMANGIDKLIFEVQKTVPAVTEFIGPAEIASPQALIKYLNKTSKSFVSIIGEFDTEFSNMCSIKADGNQKGLRKAYLNLYNKSGKGNVLGKLIYSDKDKNTENITAPSFSVAAEATPEGFYEILDARLIKSGLIPRFSIIEYRGKRPQLNEKHLYVKPSQQLIDQFAALCAYSLQLNNGNNVLEVQIEPEALKLFKDFDKYCDYQINTASNDVTRQLWNRAHIKSLKLAALLAVGCNYINPVVNVECATWALQLIVNDVTNLLSRFESGEIGANNVQNDQTTEIKKALKKYVTSSWEELAKAPGSTLITWKERIVPHAFISAFCRQRACFKNDRLGPINAIKTCITALLECGEIVELSPQQKKEKGITSGHAKAYMISGMKL